MTSELVDVFAFSVGAGTVFAPCAFPLLPGYLSYFLGQDEDTDGTGASVLRGILIGLVVSAGFFVVYGALGGVAVIFGRRLLQQVSLLELIVGSLLIVLGTVMLTGRSPSAHVQLPERRRSVGGFFAFGVLYAAAAAGCTGPLFLGVIANGLTLDPVAGVASLVAYAGGMATVMIAITAAAALGRDILVRRLAARADLIQRAAGALLVLAGFVQIYLFLFSFGGLEMLGLA